MKQSHRFLLAVFSIVLIGVCAEAQLSGTYYIGARAGSAPGGADPDFADMKAWRTRLADTVSGLVVGPCTFYLLDSSYTLGTSATLSRIQYKGAGAANAIRLKPYTGVKATIIFPTVNASSTGQMQFGDESFVWLAPQYFTIDGSNTEGGTTRDLTFNFAGQNGIRIFINSKNITIKNCVINVDSSYRGTSSSHCILFHMQYRTAAPTGYFYPDSGLVENCVLNHRGKSTGRGIGIGRSTAPADLNVGTTGLIIRNNVIFARERGISVEHAINGEIYGNTIRVQQDSARNVTGIYVERTAGTKAQTVNIYNNKIDTLATPNTLPNGTGVSGVYFSPNIAGTLNLYNNFVTGFSTPATSNGFVRGIGIDSSSATVNVYHNSIHVPAVELTDSVFGVQVRSASVGPNVTFKNNIVAVYETDDTSYCYAREGTAGTFVSDWNALWAGGGTKMGWWQGSEQATLANWQSASSQDARSKNVNPASTFGGAGQWTSAANLHFTSKPSNLFAALPVGGITKDIDGDARGSFPYMGADEVAGSPLVGVEGSSQETPLSFELLANYPNPFNPTTTIRYSVAKSCFVTLVVHNVLGQRIATLVNEYAEPGLYSLQWNGASDSGVKAASGVYYYTLRAGEFTETRSMLLTK